MRTEEHTGVCHIVSAAPGAQVQIAPEVHDMVIAADAGYRYCKEASVEPDLFVGDYDSLSEEELAGSGAQRVELPWEKDDTDTVAAVKLGLERGYKRFAIHAAVGGDVGHTLANMQLLAYLRAHGADGVLYGRGQRVVAVVPEDGLRLFDTVEGERVSVFAFGGVARGVVEHGMHWELDGATLTPDFPLGVSNKALGSQVEIGVAHGMLLVVVG